MERILENEGRIAYVDLAKGICICIVMLFHIKGIERCEYLFDPILFSFCMLPPFFFLSGLFFKEERSFSAFIRKKTNRLLIPFAFFYLTTSVIMPNVLHSLLGVDFQTVLGWPSLWAFVWPGEYPNIPLWFLWCLFVMSILFRAMLTGARKCFPHRSLTVLVVLSLGCAIVGTFVEYTFQADVANLLSALKNMPFFCLGYMAKRKEMVNGMVHTGKLSRVAVLVLSFSVMLLDYLPSLQGSVATETVLFYLCSVAGIVFLLTLCSLVGHLPLISYLGQYSIIVLLTHGLFVRVGAPFVLLLSQYTNPHCATLCFWLLMMVSYWIVIPFCRRYLPHVTAQKPLW